MYTWLRSVAQSAASFAAAAYLPILASNSF